MRIISYLVVPVFIISCAQEKQPDTTSLVDTSERVVVEEILKDYYADMSNRDWKKYRQYFWDNATITTAWQQPGDSAVKVHVISIDEFIRKTGEGPDSQPVFSEEMKNSSIKVRNNIAEAWVEYDARFGKPDSLMQWSGRDVFTFLRSEGEWRIVSLVFENK